MLSQSKISRGFSSYPVKPARIFIAYLVFGCYRYVFSRQELLDRRCHVEDSLVGKIRCPNQTVIAEQLEVSPCGEFLTALKVNSAVRDQRRWQRQILTFHPRFHFADEIGNPATAGL